MAYWCGDRALAAEQSQLDAQQQRAIKALNKKRSARPTPTDEGKA